MAIFEPLLRHPDFNDMRVSLSTTAFVDAERVGSGRLPWLWVAVCEESAVVLARSEPMFRTRSAALRIGKQVMLTKQSRVTD